MASSSVWSWKQEPASPLLHFEPDSWFSGSDNVAVEVEITDEVKATRAEHASKLLKDLDDWVKEEEPFPDWLEEKIDLPIFDDLPPPPPLMNNLDVTFGLKNTPPSVNNSVDMLGLKHIPVNMVGLKPAMVNNARIESIVMKPQPQTIIPQNPLQYQIPPSPPNVPIEQAPVLLQDLDYALVNSTTHDTLTPPESPREAELVFTMLQEMQSQELDELVRMRVESLVESPDCGESSRSSLHEESESVPSPSSDSSYSDPEWTLPPDSDNLKTTKKRRTTKPYSRTPPEEKKLRKKEQNKNAATRYRMKKKQEVEDILGEEKQLQEKNEQYKSDVTELRREIKYLKSLMRDIFKAKGLIK